MYFEKRVSTAGRGVLEYCDEQLYEVTKKTRWFPGLSTYIILSLKRSKIFTQEMDLQNQWLNGRTEN